MATSNALLQQLSSRFRRPGNVGQAPKAGLPQPATVPAAPRPVAPPMQATSPVAQIPPQVSLPPERLGTPIAPPGSIGPTSRPQTMQDMITRAKGLIGSQGGGTPLTLPPQVSRPPTDLPYGGMGEAAAARLDQLQKSLSPLEQQMQQFYQPFQQQMQPYEAQMRQYQQAMEQSPEFKAMQASTAGGFSPESVAAYQKAHQAFQNSDAFKQFQQQINPLQEQMRQQQEQFQQQLNADPRYNQLRQQIDTLHTQYGVRQFQPMPLPQPQAPTMPAQPAQYGGQDRVVTSVNRPLTNVPQYGGGMGQPMTNIQVARPLTDVPQYGGGMGQPYISDTGYFGPGTMSNPTGPQYGGQERVITSVNRPMPSVPQAPTMPAQPAQSGIASLGNVMAPAGNQTQQNTGMQTQQTNNAPAQGGGKLF